MVEVKKQDKIETIKLISDPNEKVYASYNGNGTITLKSYPLLYEGAAHYIILGRAETIALAKLFGDMKSFANICKPDETTVGHS